MPRPDKVLRDIMLGRRYRPVAFVGSGLSRPELPDWSGFIEKLAEEFPDNPAARALSASTGKDLSASELLGYADAILDSVERDRVRRDRKLRPFMERTFKITEPRKPPAIFASLVRAPFSFYLTTNYDTNIEDAFRAYRGRSLPVVRLDDLDAALRYAAEGRPFVFKIHGCAKEGGPYVISSNDYQEIIYKREDVRFVLQAILALHPIVFLGYGQRDPHIQWYLEREKQLLAQEIPRITFIQRSDPASTTGFDLARQITIASGVSPHEVKAWSEIQDLLDQFSFLQLRSRAAEVRRERLPFLKSFLREGKKEEAWDALLCASASSELGYIDESLQLWEMINSNKILREYLESVPSLSLIYHIVAGQTLKRLHMWDKATQEFAAVEKVAAPEDTLTRPLRALAFRYAGIFRSSQHFTSDRDKALEQAKALFEKAQRILGSDFREESLDQEKWLAILASEMEDDGHRKAAERLMNLAREADALQYPEGSAWCRYNHVEELRRGGIPLSPAETERLLDEAISLFEKLEHLQGLAFAHHLLAQQRFAREGGTPGTLKQAELAQAYAVITGAVGIRERAEELLEKIRKSPVAASGTAP
jgi:hypothetical protein